MSQTEAKKSPIMNGNEHLTILREEIPGYNGVWGVRVRIMFNPQGNAIHNYLSVVSVSREWMPIGKTYRTEIHWYRHSTALIAHAELLAAALLKAAEIAKELNAELPTDLPFGTVMNPALENYK